MALLVIKEAAKPIIRISSNSLSFSPRGVKKAFSTSSSKKSYEDLFAWVAADVHAHSRYTSLLARLCITGPEELGSHLPSQAENKTESQPARNNCLPRMLEKLSRKDLMDLLLCFLANNPEVVKVLFVGDAQTAFTKTKLQILFPQMINTIADECDAIRWYMHSRFRLKSEPPDLLHVFVNVSDMEKESLAVFFMYDLLVVIGKLITRSKYEKRDEKGEKHLNLIKKLYKAFGLKQQPPTGEQVILSRSRVPSKKYDLNQATGEIMEEGDELRISYPVVLEDVETPLCMHVQLIDKQMDA